MDLVKAFRKEMENRQGIGELYRSLHTFSDRTCARYFDDEWLVPAIQFEKVRASCRGLLRVNDPVGFPVDVIVIDPTKCKTGEDAAEVLVHELVHLWQVARGKAPERNYHNEEFHNRMGLLGILTSGKAGHHCGYVEGGQWQDWLDENDDLLLAKFILPGADPQPEPRRRSLITWRCPSCGFNFRSRKRKVKVVCQMKACNLEMIRDSDQ